MMNKATWDFARLHRDDDPRRLALSGTRAHDVDLGAALQQIAGWQAARRKLPTWAATEGLLYPARLSMEQCSSEATARYKAGIVSRLGASSLCDVTGGFGVDFAFMGQALSGDGAARRAVYIERQEELCRIVEHNIGVLRLDQAEVVCGDGTAWLQQHDEPFDMVFADPARRDAHGGRTYALPDCSPDATLLLPLLRQRARHVLLKLSPMLDWRQAAAQLPGTTAVHIVSVQNECKELLLLLDFTAPSGQPLQVVCVDLSPATQGAGHEVRDMFSYEVQQQSEHGSGPLAPRNPHTTRNYLYEPNASVMKAGCFELLCRRFGVEQLAANSHLFTSDVPAAGFPGRAFRILAVSSLNKKELRQTLRGLTQANIAVRNFPLTAAELRRRLKLRDGGDIYLFATTQADGSHVLFACEKTVSSPSSE